MGFYIKDQHVNALANEVKRMLGTRTKEQAVGIALADLLDASRGELSPGIAPVQDKPGPRST
jgi:hypothetical protein